ncbi:MAG: hypothetical protein R3F11_33095, partial [Verrucomicrobiales bacterium]
MAGLTALIGCAAWAVYQRGWSPPAAGEILADQPSAPERASGFAVDAKPWDEPADPAPPLPPVIDRAALAGATLPPPPAAELTVPAIEEFPIYSAKALEQLELATLFNGKGEMQGALKALNAAAAELPEHPKVLYELASALEQMQLGDRAMDVWERIYALGRDGGGSFWELADLRLRGAGKGDSTAPD